MFKNLPVDLWVPHPSSNVYPTSKAVVWPPEISQQQVLAAMRTASKKDEDFGYAMGISYGCVGKWTIPQKK